MANQSRSSDGGLGEAVDRDGGGLGLRRRLDMKVSGSGFRDADWLGEGTAVGAARLWREVAAGGAAGRGTEPLLSSYRAARGCENAGGRVVVLRCA